MRAATDGWFDAWAVPGGFDPGGLLGGWAVERAAARLRAAGITDYAVLTGADLVVRGHAAHGGPWRVAVHHPTDSRRAPLVLEMTAGAVGTSGVSGRQGHVVDPHTGEPAGQLVAATVVGPDLAVADAYATALYAAGPAGLALVPQRVGTTGRSSPTGAAERRCAASADLRTESTGRAVDAGDRPPRSRQRPWGPVSDECAWLAHSRGAGRPAGRRPRHPKTGRHLELASDRTDTLANRRNSTQESPQRTVVDGHSNYLRESRRVRCRPR